MKIFLQLFCYQVSVSFLTRKRHFESFACTQQTAWNNGDIENFMKGYWKMIHCFLSVQKDQLTVGKKH